MLKLIPASGTVVEGGSLKDLLAIAHEEDEIFLGELTTDAVCWRTHPEGYGVHNHVTGAFVLKTGDREEVVFQGSDNGWCGHPDGFVIRDGGNHRFLLNGKTEIPGEKLYHWGYHPFGKVERDGDRLVLHMEKSGVLEPAIVLYEGPIDQWCEHPQGVMVRAGRRIFVNETLVYEGDLNWFPQPHLYGIVFERDHKLTLIVHRDPFMQAA